MICAAEQQLNREIWTDYHVLLTVIEMNMEHPYQMVKNLYYTQMPPKIYQLKL